MSRSPQTHKYVTTANDPVSGHWRKLIVVTAAEIADIAYQDGYGASNDDLNGVTLPALFVLEAPITNLELTSGTVILQA